MAIGMEEMKFLEQEKKILVERVFLEKSYQPTSMTGNGIPQGMLMLTNKRLFFFTKGLGKSNSNLVLREVPGGVASVLTLGLAGEAVHKIMEFAEGGVSTLIERLEYNDKIEGFLNDEISFVVPLQRVSSCEKFGNNNWITANHDIFGTRSSNQTTIGMNNVDKLQVKWVLNTPNMVENSPIIMGDRGYVQDNDGVVYAFNATTGQNIWKDSIGPGGLMHGLTYDQNVLFVGSGKNATVLAINATDGKKIWESPTLGPKTLGYGVATPPLVWKNYVGLSNGNKSQKMVQGNRKCTRPGNRQRWRKHS